MRKNLKEERIGLEFTTNEGYQVIIIDYVTREKIQIMFLDEHKWTTWTKWNTLKNGEIKNPFHKSVYGVGYLGVDENGERIKTTNGTGKTTREYNLWHGMLQRCYDEKFHIQNPTYKNDTVWSRWHSLANFLTDMDKIREYELWQNNPNSGISLNKDKYYAELGIETDCKEYNLETTRFITRPENTKEMLDRQGNPKPRKKVRCVETGVIYESIKQASEKTGLFQGDISKCCNGIRKTCGKCHWEFVD